MNPRIIEAEDVLVIGMRADMSFSTINIETGNLARKFMPRRREIKTRIGTHAFSIQNYKDFKLETLTPHTNFEKWVAVEVSNFNNVPNDMESFTLKGGTYAVFQYKGMAANFPKVWQNIFTQWLPNSRYVLDDRAHFEKLPENYNPLDPNAEEEIWIPVKEASEV